MNVSNYTLDVDSVALRLGISTSTLNGWLKNDQQRPEDRQVFAFHRWRGRSRFWSEASFEQLENAIHHQSQHGVLATWRVRNAMCDQEPDPDAEDALARVIGAKVDRTY